MIDETNNQQSTSEQDTEQQLQTESKENVPKKNKFKSIGEGLKTAKNTVHSRIDKAIDYRKNQIEKSNTIKEINANFQKEAINFWVYVSTDKKGNKSYKSIYAIKFPQEGYMLVRANDSICAHDILCGENNQAFEVYDFDKSHLINYPDNSDTYHIECYKIFYRLYEKKEINVINQTQNQNINIGGNNNANITMVAKQQTDLEELGKYITDCKPGLLHKKQKEEAIELYGTFKNCVINKEKEESLFSKFLKILVSLGLTAATAIAKSLISNIT